MTNAIKEKLFPTSSKRSGRSMKKNGSRSRSRSRDDKLKKVVVRNERSRSRSKPTSKKTIRVRPSVLIS